MRHTISTLLTTLLFTIAILPTAVQAQTTRVPKPAIDSLSPFNLTYLAYQGYLEDQGIPSNGALMNAIAAQTIAAQDLIQAAVKTNRLPEQALRNQGYRHDLDVQLHTLIED